jgi:hypothetical protein
VAARQGRITDLEACLAESERMHPDDLMPFLGAASELLSRGEGLTSAEAYLRKYLSQPPEPDRPPHGLARWRLGHVLEKQGRKREAISDLEAASRQLTNASGRI